jgi:hypothetical protein
MSNRQKGESRHFKVNDDEKRQWTVEWQLAMKGHFNDDYQTGWDKSR